MDPITLAAIIGGGFSLIGSGVNAGVNLNQNKKTRQWQEDMYNKYYSPMSQMQQMTAAGINPNLAAQGISGSPGISMPQASNGNNAMNLDVNGAIEAYTRMKLSDAEEKNINADTENKEADTESKRIKNKYLDEYWQNNVDKLKAEITKLGIDSSVAAQMLENLKQKFNQSEELFPLQKDKLMEEANEIRKNIQKMDKEMDVMDKQMEVMDSEKSKNYAQARKDNASAAIDEFIVENGYRPDDPQAQALRGLVSDNEEERKDAENFIDAYNNFVEGAANAKEKGQVEGTPEGREKIRLEEERDKKIAEIDKQIADLKDQMHKSYYSHRKNELRSEMQSLEKSKDKINRQYRRHIRRVSKGVSGGISVMGNGGSIGT